MAAGMRVGVPDFVVEPIEKVMREREGLAVRSRFGAGAGPFLHDLDVNPVAACAEGAGCLVLDAASTLGGL
jgi:hypothetical protein